MKTKLIRLAFLIFSVPCIGQNLKKDEGSLLALKASGAISSQGIVKGYYFFYQAEKSSKTSNNYLLQILDEDFREIDKITFTKPITYKLIETSFNGAAYLFLFFDSKNKKSNLLSFSDKLKKLGDIENPVTNKAMLENYTDLVNGFELGEKYLATISDTGFIQFQNGLITAYNNNLDELWFERISGQPSEAFQFSDGFGFLITRTYTDERFVEYDLLINNPNSGQRVSLIPIKSNLFCISPLSLTFEPLKKNIVIFCSFFNKKDNPLTENSLGFCTLIYDISGKYLSSKTIYKEELRTKAVVNYNNNTDELRDNILFHSFIQTNDGKTFVIGEEFKKKTSVGKMLLSRYSPPVHIDVYNLVIFEINTTHDLEKTHIIKKNKSKIFFGHVRVFSSQQALSRIAKKEGGFDFRFCQEYPDKDIFSIVYKDTDIGNREDVLGTITYTPEKTMKLNKIRFKFKTSFIEAFPAKPGYLLLAEYDRKEKKTDIRLEKINY